MSRLRILGRSIAAVAVLTAAFGVQAGLSAAPSAPSTVVTVDPARILDTRIAVGVPGTTPVGQGGSIDVQVTGVGGVPVSATGVIVTITATQASTSTFITAYPTGSAQSTTSVLNASPGVDIANTVTMSLGTGGKITLYNNGGTVHLVADVTGYLLPGGVVAPHVERHTIELAAYSAAYVGNATPTNFGCINLGTNGEIYLDVPLPDGAAVQKVDLRYYDTDLANFTMLVSEVDQQPFGAPTSSGTLIGGQTQSTGSVGYGTASVTVTGGDKASPTVRYQIDAFTLGVSGGGAHYFCGASVTYDIEV